MDNRTAEQKSADNKAYLLRALARAERRVAAREQELESAREAARNAERNGGKMVEGYLAPYESGLAGAKQEVEDLRREIAG